MKILSDEQYRLLAFVAACNGSSYNPTAREVMLWRNNPDPREAEYRTVEVPGIGAGLAGLHPGGSFSALAGLYEPSESVQRMIDTITGRQLQSIHESLSAIASRYITGPRTRRELVKEAETVIDHLIRLTWLETVTVSGRTGLRLTELGRALLHNREYETATQPDVSVVVLEGDDPLAYPFLVGQLAEAGEGLLIDPYLKLDALHRIVTSTRLTRLLVSGKPGNRAEVAAMQTYLDSQSLARHVEVRASTEVHDRILLTDDGTVLTLGTSLNSVGRTTTVLTPMPSNAGAFLRNTSEEIWGNATLVGPQPSEEETEAEEDETESETEETGSDESGDVDTTGADTDDEDETDGDETDAGTGDDTA